MTATRGTTNGNVRGNSETRRRRREWLVQTYRADVDGIVVKYIGAPPEREDLNTTEVWVPREQTDYGFARLVTDLEDEPDSWEVIAPRVALCRCYRCGKLLTADTVTADRIIPGDAGGTYRRDNIRPACGPCNSITGNHYRWSKPRAKAVRR